MLCSSMLLRFSITHKGISLLIFQTSPDNILVEGFMANLIFFFILFYINKSQSQYVSVFQSQHTPAPWG